MKITEIPNHNLQIRLKKVYNQDKNKQVYLKDFHSRNGLFEVICMMVGRFLINSTGFKFGT